MQTDLAISLSELVRPLLIRMSGCEMVVWLYEWDHALCHMWRMAHLCGEPVRRGASISQCQTAAVHSCVHQTLGPRRGHGPQLGPRGTVHGFSVLLSSVLHLFIVHTSIYLIYLLNLICVLFKSVFIEETRIVWEMFSSIRGCIITEVWDIWEPTGLL